MGCIGWERERAREAASWGSYSRGPRVRKGWRVLQVATIVRVMPKGTWWTSECLLSGNFKKGEARHKHRCAPPNRGVGAGRVWGVAV